MDVATNFDQHQPNAIAGQPPEQRRRGTNVAEDEPWTVKRILEWTTNHLQAKGCETPRLDAEILLAAARNCQRIDLYVRYDEILTDSERAAMREMVQRRSQHEPVAYLVGHREFFGLDIHVNSDVLVPRPETETLVVEILSVIEEIDQPRVLEVGTGSGCIAVAIAKQNLRARIIATDISSAAIEVAQQNATRLQVDDRIEFVCCDLLSEVQPVPEYDVLVSNPPYVCDGEMPTLQPDVRLHEPHLALAAGADGLDVVRRIIEQAPAYVRPGGFIGLEIDGSQAATVFELFEQSTKWEDGRIVNDISHTPRVVTARRKQN